MMRLPKKCLIDTNVPINANRALKPNEVPEELTQCVLACVGAIKHVVENNNKLVIDDGDEIYDEYHRNLSMSGQPGVGDGFMKWVHDHQWNPHKTDRVAITKDGDSYKEFPQHDCLINFDISDRKFIAVANIHKEKPPILQATDCKWWGWKEALTEVGVKVKFLCPNYVEGKYKEKIGCRGT